MQNGQPSKKLLGNFFKICNCLRDPATAVWALIPEKTDFVIRHMLYTVMFTAALFIISKTRNNLVYPLMDEWLNKLWFIHTMEYDSATKRNKLLIYNKVKEKSKGLGLE